MNASDLMAARSLRFRLLHLRVWVLVSLLIAGDLPLLGVANADTLNGHTVALDGAGKIIPWTPDPSDGYGHVVNIAWDYFLNRVPNDPATGKPAYFSQSYLDPDTQQMAGWPHNPAGLYAMIIESALKYYAYSGDPAAVFKAEELAAHHLGNGMTPQNWSWGNVPYASGDAGSLVYRGAAYGNTSGAGDGTYYLEPDKIGELGYGWLLLYKFGADSRYRDAAIHAADVLASKVRPGNATESPWPFRVQAQTGQIREQYCAHVVSPVELFDELIRLGLGNTAAYQSARQIAWNWFMNYPMQNGVWANYFEDVPVINDRTNINQMNPMMLARYLMEHPENDTNWQAHVRSLIGWVESHFAAPQFGANSIIEQNAFPHAMGSHTSRYAAINAMLYARTGDVAAREKAYRAFNWATYMARTDGIVIDGPTVNNQWFTDGYGDYIRHFLTGLHAVPEWAPDGQTHITGSSSVVRSVSYGVGGVQYDTADSAATEVLRVAFVPSSVFVGGQQLSQRTDLTQQGWLFEPSTGVLRVRHDSGTHVEVVSNGAGQDDGTVSVWNYTPTPTDPLDPDASAIELGVKFRSDVDGFITGIRFFKGGTANSGTHLGHLWSSTGNLLAEATFQGETTSGWQQVKFQTPVAIAANTVYVASYYAPNGHYAADVGYFARQGVDNAPLHLLRDGDSGGNGVYAYGSTAFPTHSWGSSNYWVDVVYTASVSPGPITPPPSSPGISVERVVFKDGRGAVGTAAFSIGGANELLLAFVASDGPSTGGQTAAVSGAGLNWTLVRRANGQAGTSEVWQAFAPAPLASAAVQSIQSLAPYDQSLMVIVLTGANGVGANAGASARSGSPAVALTTTAPNAWVFGVGNDWDSAAPRTLGAGQTMVHEWVDTAAGDTFWVQRLFDPVSAPGTLATIHDTAPTADRWNLIAVEIVPQ